MSLEASTEVLWTLPVCYSAYVNTQEIITALDAEIARLQHARSVIASSGTPKATHPAKAGPSAIPTPEAEALTRGTEEDRGSSEEALGEAEGRKAGSGHEGSRQEAT